MAEPPRARLRTRLLLWLIVGAVRGLGPLRRPAGTAVALVWYAKQPRAVRRRAAVNHRRLAPQLSAAAARRRARASYREYVWMMLDGIWVEPLSAGSLRSIIDYEGAEFLNSGNGIMVTSHFGNWDIGASSANALGLPMTTVMATVGPPATTELVELSRRRKEFELFTPRQAARGLIRALRRGRWVALMLDVPEAGPTVVVPFCGGPVRVSAVPARLAAGTARPIVPVACWRVGERWRVRIHPPVHADPLEDDSGVMARVAAALEPEIRRHPEQWYPFHDVFDDGAG
ncbi:MAG TPA: lysophospholipid acyltransferase family protein [Candidatus Dormibacteraeota bacterium]